MSRNDTLTAMFYVWLFVFITSGYPKVWMLAVAVAFAIGMIVPWMDETKG